MTRPPLGSSDRLLDRIALIALVATAGAALATFRHYGLGWDDFTHAQMGEKLLALYGSGFRDTSALSFVNLYMYGGGFDMLAALAAKALPFDLFETRRLIGAAVGIAGMAVTWRLTRRVGGSAAGLIALLLLALCPIFYGHMFINAKDAPFAVAMVTLLYALVRVVEEYPRPAPATVMLFGFGLGLTIGTRVMGVIAGVYAGLALAFILAAELRTFGWRPALARTGRFLLTLSPGFLFGYLVMGLLWPWAVTAPLNPLKALAYFSVFFEKPWREEFNGQLISVPDMPWTYLPTMLGIQLPEIMLALALAGVLLVGWQIVRGSLSIRQRGVRVLLLAAVLAPIAATLAMRPAMYNGFRHLLFLLPAMAVLGGLAGGWLWERMAHAGRPALIAVAGVLALGLASPAIEMVRLHPLEYTHYNRIEGGVKGAENRFMLDYWGLSFKQAAQQLRATLTERLEQPPHGRRWKIAVCGPHPPAEVELGPQFELTWDPRGADFALMLGTYYCMQYGAPVLAEVRRDGVVYARAYDIRQRSYSTLFTTPPP
jgi:4-amino-4-deoxy-L-arabinose transferase-like glycosyltransferase